MTRSSLEGGMDYDSKIYQRLPWKQEACPVNVHKSCDTVQTNVDKDRRRGTAHVPLTARASKVGPPRIPEFWSAQFRKREKMEENNLITIIII